MIRSALSFFASIFIFAATTFATEPFTVFEGKDASTPKQPQACLSSDGAVHITFGVGDQVFYCKVKDDKCSAPQPAFRVPNMSLGMRRGPRIAHSGASITITAIGGTQGKGRDGDIQAYRSLDLGKTWLGPVKVNDVDGSGREGLHAMTSGDDGALWCVWLDLREKGTVLYASKSMDHGETWSNNILVYRSPDGSICECCHPSIIASDNTVQVLFRNSLKGDRDMYLVTSLDQGTSFGEARRLGRTNWHLNACPMDGGMLAVNGRGEFNTVWRRDRTILSSGTKPAAETLLGTGEQPWTSASADGFFTVWTTKRDGDLQMLKPGSTQIETLSENSSYPVVVSSSDANSSAYVLWEIVAQKIQ
jgi:hypothetical protein